MKWLSFLWLALCGCHLESNRSFAFRKGSVPMERIIVAPNGRGFETALTKQAFYPWGMNYGNSGRLMEDFWDEDWKTFADDFAELKALGANVVRVHLQYGKFMDAPDQPNRAAFH